MQVKTLIWSGNALSGANFSDTYPVNVASSFTPIGEVVRVFMNGNSNAGSVYFIESGTAKRLATLTAGSNASDASHPKHTIEDSNGVAIGAGSGNIWTTHVATNPIFITGSGFTSGTSNKLGTILLDYKI